MSFIFSYGIEPRPTGVRCILGNHSTCVGRYRYAKLWQRSCLHCCFLRLQSGHTFLLWSIDRFTIDHSKFWRIWILKSSLRRYFSWCLLLQITKTACSQRRYFSWCLPLQITKTACSQKQLVFKKQAVFENKLFFLAKKVNGPLVFGTSGCFVTDGQTDRQTDGQTDRRIKGVLGLL